MLGSPEKIRFAAFRIARTDFHVGRSHVNCDRRGAAPPPEWFSIPVSPNIGAPRLVSDRPSRALQAARARPKRVQHVQQDDHRRLPSGRNPGGRILRGSRVEEFDFESASKKPLRGNIYLAKVTRVEPSLQAAFVDYGGNRHGFLAFSEIHPDYYQIPVADRQALLEEEARSHREDEDEPNGERRSRRHRRSRAPESEMRAREGERVSETAPIEPKPARARPNCREPALDFAPPERSEFAPEADAVPPAEAGAEFVAPDHADEAGHVEAAPAGEREPAVDRAGRSGGRRAVGASP